MIVFDDLRRESVIKIKRRKQCIQVFPNQFLIVSSISFHHGGRGALPSAGGHPSDLTFLAGGGGSGIEIPIYYFGSQSLVENAPSGELSCIPGEEQSILDALLLAQWEDRMRKDCFRYDVTTSEIKVISGRRKFLAQLNEGWSMDYLSKSQDSKVCHQWDPFLFDCMKHEEELLFCVASSQKENSELIPSAAVPNGAISVIINVTPVEYGHVFLIPCGSNRLYSLLDARSLEMVVRVAVEIDNSSFRLFYDCCRPNVSHTYFQACYFPDLLPVELMPADIFFSDGQRGIHISTVKDFPIKNFLFECTFNIKIMVEIISEICSHLREKNIPYNLLISDCGKKIFLFLQLQKLSSSCTLSAWECGGYFLFNSRFEFNQATEEAMLKRLSTVSLVDEDFQVVKQLCCSIASKFAI